MNSRSIRHLIVPGLLVLGLCPPASISHAQNRRVEGKAPPDHAILKSTRDGAYFVAKELKEEYDKLVAQVRTLRDELRNEQIGSADALTRMRLLQERLQALRTEIEARKVLVAPVKTHVQEEVTMFDLGPDRLLVITADNLNVEGWDGPGVKCVLEKTILAPDDEPVDDHLKGLKVVHDHGRALGIVGKTQAEWDVEEEAYLASPDGKKLDEAQRASRHKFVQEIADSYRIYRNLQGKQVDTIEVTGITGEQGNRQISVRVESPNGGAMLGGHWQRHAALTVYVPRCQSLVLRGCLVHLDVRDVEAPVIVTRSGSHDRDYDGTFGIHNVKGSLTVNNAPLDVIEGVQGDISIESTMELANTGTQHEGGQRHFYTPPPRQLVCRDITGDFSAWFSRVDLQLYRITGKIDVRNEFGDTFLAIDQPLVEASHRVFSQSGRVEVSMKPDSLGSLPVQVLTSCGSIRTNTTQQMFDSTSFSTGSSPDGTGREWRGMKSRRKGDEQGMHFFEGMERLNAVLTGAPRGPGFDVINRAGAVIVTVEP